MNIGLAGEFKIDVVKVDSGELVSCGEYQKNIILDRGLDWLGGTSSFGLDFYCCIGSGNSAPVASQLYLDYILSAKQGSGLLSSAYSGQGDYVVTKTNTYMFDSLGFDVNVSEIGLAARYKSNSDYTLSTRALIKDSLGQSSSISLLSDERLIVTYKLHQVFNTSDITKVINVTDKNGVVTPYNTITRLFGVGKAGHYGDTNNFIAKPFRVNYSGGDDYTRIYQDGELGGITKIPTGTQIGRFNNGELGAYVSGSFKNTLTYSLGFNDLIGNIRCVSIPTTLGFFQIRYGKVSDDSPLTKTQQEKMILPFEFSWGRYEGVL